MTALGAALLFFFSILLHELAHALVANALGVPVRRITLFLFGGLAEMSDEPRSAKAEFFIAVVGPLTSFIIGGIAVLWGRSLVPPAARLMEENPLQALAMTGPLATLLLWLGPVNLLLAGFNLVPGFPLDGGRLLRALLWSTTGDLLKATRWAAHTGRAFAWLLMGGGVAMALGLSLPIFGTGLLSGLWLLLIGWFLNNAAQAGYQQVLRRQTLRGVPVAQLMNSTVDQVPPDFSVQELVDTKILHSDQRAFPVVQDGSLAGLVCLEDIRRTPRERWAHHSVRDIMTPLPRLVTVGPQDDAEKAMSRLSEQNVSQIPVVGEQGRFLGIVRLQDVFKWMSLGHQ